MKDITFDTLNDLYKRILPALKSRRKILNKTGYSYISEKDIFNALRYTKWSENVGLELCEMVDDILHADEKIIIDYYKEQESININEEKEYLPKLK